MHYKETIVACAGGEDRSLTHRTLLSSWQEYCHSTAIHGVRYLVEGGRSRFERVFWVLSLTLALAGSVCLIKKAYTKWDDSPVIVSFAEKTTPIWMVPFPAVTVCPVTKSRQRVFNYTDIYYRYFDYRRARQGGAETSNATDLDNFNKTYLEAVALVCDQQFQFPELHRIIDSESMDVIRTVAPPVDEVIWRCYWQGIRLENCSSLFTPYMSDDGLCYTFNMLSNKELFTPLAVQYNESRQGRASLGWNLEDGYPANASLETFPRRALLTAAKYNLVIKLGAFTPDCDNLCKGPGHGFKVLLHNPAEIPRIGRQQHFLAQFNQELVAMVKPSMMTTSDGLRDYHPVRRQCYFPYERQLRYFKVYTQRSCELECLTNYTVRSCGCTAFYMPRSADIPICGPGSNFCLNAATESLVKHEIQRELERQGGRTSAENCNCLQACTSLEYDVETSQADFELQNLLQALRMPTNALGKGVAGTLVSIYFKDTQFITSRRSELFGLTDFFANCGGLLGLFSGFSLISLIEILYYLSIRLWCNVHRRRKEFAEVVETEGAFSEQKRQESALKTRSLNSAVNIDFHELPPNIT